MAKNDPTTRDLIHRDVQGFYREEFDKASQIASGDQSIIDNAREAYMEPDLWDAVTEHVMEELDAESSIFAEANTVSQSGHLTVARKAYQSAVSRQTAD